MNAPMIMLATQTSFKKKNTIVQQWPERPKLRPDQPGAQEELDTAVMRISDGTTCYLEWQKEYDSREEMLADNAAYYRKFKPCD